MNHQLFLDYYQHLQFQIMYQELIDLKFASVGFCEIFDSPVFNLALVRNEITEEQIKTIETEMKKLHRKSSIYFENTPTFAPFVKKLQGLGYAKEWEDCWMFADEKGLDTSRFERVKKVENQNDLEQFLETFDACYQENDPQNPYGELGSYIDVARGSWFQHRGTDRVEYFLVLKGDTPVAVSTLTNFAGIGYISNVGSLREVRGEGFGKVATQYCVYKSAQNGNTSHCLATEEGHYPNAFYTRIGFKTKLTAVGFVKK